jgi:hypothetical protein
MLQESVDQYNLLFLGFSFSDVQVCEIVRNNFGSKKHFAILHESEIPALKAARAAGVIPITVSS